MTDDLVKLLRGKTVKVEHPTDIEIKAARRIEADAATIANLRAENERLRKRGERLHRRAQKAEGKIARTTVFLNSLHSISKSRVKELGASFMRYFDAAIHHARSGSNIGFHLGYFQHKSTTERLEAVSAQLTAMTANADALAGSRAIISAAEATYDADCACDECEENRKAGREARALIARHNQLRKEG